MQGIPPLRLAVAGGVAAAVAVALFAGVVALRGDGPESGIQSIDPAQFDLKGLTIDAQGVLDSDLDGLADALESVVHGSDPSEWNSTGTGIPDGWLAEHGLSPTDRGAAQRPAAVPGASDLPPAYGNRWPSQFTPTVLDVYRHGRPDTWNEATQGPFRNGLDPREWDANGDRIPDGWLLHHGLDPLDANLADARLAGPAGLTVREAFERGTDPTSLDSDGDGLPDTEEIAGPVNPRHPDGPARFKPSDPSRADSTGSGVCDGYLVAHGLDPSLPETVYGDLDLDGATTREEYLWSLGRVGESACALGSALDPRDAKSGASTIPDGWLIRFGLDPFQEGVDGLVTQESQRDPHPEDVPAVGPLKLTVLDEYRFGRPADWLEERDGPWWGGTDPALNDTDGDGLGDAWERVGYKVSASREPGEEPEDYFASLDPTIADSDADGLFDVEEAKAGSDGRKPDTDFDGLGDGQEVALAAELKPTLADSAGDLLRDGERYYLLLNRSAAYATNGAYEYPGKDPRQITDLPLVPAALDRTLGTRAADLFGPLGDMDGDHDLNIVDKDMDDDGLHNGLELDPTLFQGESDFDASMDRPVTDPLNLDTDGDQLNDWWEAYWGRGQTGSNLDPANWDSDGDQVSDELEDPDGDSVAAWFGMVGNQPHSGSFLLNNRLEHNLAYDMGMQRLLNPNNPDIDGDKLTDGWEILWMRSGGPNPPNVQTAQAVDADASILFSVSYKRYVPSQSSIEVLADANDPRILVEASGTAVGGLVPLSGSFNFRFHDAQRLQTSPHSQDNDGDGSPDWWEDLYGSRLSSLRSDYLEDGGCKPGASSAPRPTVADGGADPDGDGLTNREEFDAGGDPLCADTDLGGIKDGQEASLGGLLDINDPTDDRGDGRDADQDGLSDADEILGIVYDDLGDAPVRTDPFNPDSDGDGLLDGPDRPEPSECWKVSLSPAPTDNATARRFLDLGMAYKKVAQCYTIQGERGFQGSRTLDPTESDDCGCGLPAGWQEVYGRSKSLPHYNLGKPSWWSEQDHGPWWGGAAPADEIGPLERQQDLDGDGLLDKDPAGDPSEDLFPAANFKNEIRVIPGAASDPLDPAASPVARRLAAQAFLNPPPYGNVTGYPTVDHPREPKGVDNWTCTVLKDVQTKDVLAKGAANPVTGYLRRCSDNAAVPNVAVQAFIGKGLFGADFTDDNGRFEIALDVSDKVRSIGFPAAPVHSAFRGEKDGSVSWRPDPSVVPTGNAVVDVQSYAMGPLDLASGWKRSEVHKAIRVDAEAILEVSAPLSAPSGQDVPIVVRLRDSGGAPLDMVDIHVLWNGALVQPDPMRTTDGELAVDLPAVPAKQAGLVHLRVTSATAGSLSGKTIEKDIRIQSAGIVSVDPVPAADAGTAIDVRGLVARSIAVGSQQSIANVPVAVHIERDGAIVAPEVSTASGPDGRFVASLDLPKDLVAGSLKVVATVDESEKASAARGERTMQVRSLPAFTKVTLGELSVGLPQVVSGTLVEPGGSVAVAGAPVDVLLGDAEGHGTTDANGTFSVTLNTTLRPGRILQALAFAGDAAHAPSAHSAERTVSSPTRLVLPSGIVAAGGDARVPVTLLDRTGGPVPGAALALRWGSEAVRSVVTDANGTAVLVRPGTATDALGPVLVEARYSGNAGAGLGNSTAQAVWTVRSLAAIELPVTPVDAGGPVPAGRLVDAGTGVALAGRPVNVRLDDRLTVLKTDSRGRFPLMAPTPVTSDPATLRVTVSFDGDATYPATSAKGEVQLRSPTRVEALVPALLVAGQPSQVTAEVTDARGLPAVGGTLQAFLGGRPAGAANVDGPTVILTVRLPEDTPGGPGMLVLAYSGSPTHGVSSESADVDVVAHAALVLEAEPVRVGEPVTLTVQLLIAGQPAAGEAVRLQVEGLAEGLVGITDDAGTASFQLQQGSEGFKVIARFVGGESAGPAAAAGVLVALPDPGFFERNAAMLPWIVAAAALVLAGGALAAWRTGRHPMAPALARARRILRARGPLEQQVLQAYATIEDAAIGAGILPRPARTPRSLQQALAPALPEAAQSSLGTLIGVFEAARYGRDPLHEGQRDAAVAALRQIGRALFRAPRAGAVTGVPA